MFACIFFFCFCFFLYIFYDYQDRNPLKLRVRWKSNSCAFDAVIEVLNILPVDRAILLQLMDFEGSAKVPGIQFILESKTATTNTDLFRLQKKMKQYAEGEDSSYSNGDFYHPTTLLAKIFRFSNLKPFSKPQVDLIRSTFFHQWQGSIICPNKSCPQHGKEVRIDKEAEVEFVYGLGLIQYPRSTMLHAGYLPTPRICESCNNFNRQGMKQLISFAKILVCQVNPACSNTHMPPPLEVKAAGATYNLVGAIVREPRHFYCFVRYSNKWVMVDNLHKQSSYIYPNILPCVSKKRGYGYELLFYVLQ